MDVSFFEGCGDFGAACFEALADVAGTPVFASSASFGVLSCPMVTHTASPMAATVSAAATISAVGFGGDFFLRLFEEMPEELGIPVSKTAASPGSRALATEASAGPPLGVMCARSDRSYAFFFSGLSKQTLAAATSLSNCCDSAACLPAWNVRKWAIRWLAAFSMTVALSSNGGTPSSR